MKESGTNNDFRKPLFNFYINRGYAPVENFQNFNRLLGGGAVVVSLIAGDPIGIGLSVIGAGAAVTNEVRLSRLKNQVHHDHQGVIRSVYNSQKK